MQIDNWTRRRHVIEHTFEAPAGSVPDLQDTRSARRMVIRPRDVTIYQVPDTNLVSYAVIEGQRVRRDGELAGRKAILAGFTEWRDSVPPWWLNDMLTELGLAWKTETPVPAP